MFLASLCNTLCPFLFCSHLDGEERAASFTLIVIVIVLLLFLTVQWVGLQCMIVVFPD